MTHTSIRYPFQAAPGGGNNDPDHVPLSEQLHLVLPVVATMKAPTALRRVILVPFTLCVVFLTRKSCAFIPLHAEQQAGWKYATTLTTTTTTVRKTTASVPVVLYATTSEKPEAESSSSTTSKNGKQDVEKLDFEDDIPDLITDFCVGTNTFWKGLVIKPVRDYVQIQPAGTARSDIISKLIAPPEVPGIPRPVWLTILGSVPTALGWYGYYKFSVEEELYQYELQQGNGKVSGCGGYGTLFPFVYGVIIGFPLSIIVPPVGNFVLEAAGLWILLGQVNLYRRVNELCEEAKDELGLVDGKGPLWEWWAFLPPPLDVVVGLRQVHFLSEYWRIKRGEEYEKDIIAEELFPFISAKNKFTLKEFVRTPSMWFWFTKDWKDFDYEFLQD